MTTAWTSGPTGAFGVTPHRSHRPVGVSFTRHVAAQPVRPFAARPPRHAGAGGEGPTAVADASRSASSTRAATGSRTCSRARHRGAATASRSSCPIASRSSTCGSASVKLGVIVVPINVLYRGAEIGHIMTDAAARRPWSRRRSRGDFRATCPCWDVDALERRAGQRRQRSAHRCASTPRRLSALVYTSGTTGASKGAVLTHGNFAANALRCVTAWGITSADRYLAALPLFHVHGSANGLQCWLASGCHMRLVERFEHDSAAGVVRRRSGRRCSSACRRCTCACSNCRRDARARSARACGCSSPARRRCRRRCSRTFARGSGTSSSSATA